MSWKKFLLDWRKILLTIFLIFVFSPKPCGTGSPTGVAVECSCYGLLDTSVHGAWDFPYIYQCYGVCDFTCDKSSSEFILSLVFQYRLGFELLLILYSYLISCLIVWAYDKATKEPRIG
jgi:hypothetical protein